MRYVLGFAFDKDRQRVILIRKNKPDWQAGKLNGVGGKVEGDESVIRAMVREFFEETGAETSTTDWEWYGRIYGDGAEVHVFRTFLPHLSACQTMTQELVGAFRTDVLGHYPCLPNVPALIGMALDPQAPLFVLDYRSGLKGVP